MAEMPIMTKLKDKSVQKMGSPDSWDPLAIGEGLGTYFESVHIWSTYRVKYDLVRKLQIIDLI